MSWDELVEHGAPLACRRERRPLVGVHHVVDLARIRPVGDGQGHVVLLGVDGPRKTRPVDDKR
jgi:hypothetical protein